jgi:hypothetical protein
VIGNSDSNSDSVAVTVTVTGTGTGTRTGTVTVCITIFGGFTLVTLKQPLNRLCAFLLLTVDHLSYCKLSAW